MNPLKKDISESNKESFLKKVITSIVIIISMIILFSVLLIIAYILPNSRIQHHIKESKDYYPLVETQSIYKDYIKNSTFDSFTDLLVLNISMNKGKSENESLIVRAFENSRYYNEEESQSNMLLASIDDEELYNNKGYARYWHGNQTIYRPLLLFFNYEEIRFFLVFILFILIAISMAYISKNISFMHSILFLISLIAVGINIVPLSMQFFPIFAVTFFAVIIVNILFEEGKEKYFPYLFLIMGGLTAFYDLLTVPAITLGIPAVIILLLMRSKEENYFKKELIRMIEIAIFWLIGYGIISLSKWVISTIVLKINVIQDALDFIFKKADSSSTSRMGAVTENISFLNNAALKAVLIITIIIWIISLLKYRKKVDLSREIKICTLLLILAICPYIWYMVLPYHSTVHAIFTFRLQAISVFSILCILFEFIDYKKIEDKKR